LTGPDGSLEDATGSLTGPDGSLAGGSTAEGSVAEGSTVIVEGSLGDSGSDAGDLATLGSLAAAGIGIGIAVSGGVNLPPLPEINVGAVCQLPQEAIDFLKYNGSMEQDECEPEEEQN
ncbi:hypothetical protein G6024_15110, partial [Dietzia maris]|nr:hypothetical protein [Dietzia maris]